MLTKEQKNKIGNKKVIAFIESIQSIPYMSMKGKIDASWNVSFGKDIVAALDAAQSAAGDVALDAAGDAAWDAAWSAAGDAARSAAGDAARSAAGDAAWDAAWSAAGDAAGDAARSAAGDAAGDAALYARCLLVSDVKSFDKKHLIHAKARMDVWIKGYGLYCDANGKLFVYGIKKEVQ